MSVHAATFEIHAERSAESLRRGVVLQELMELGADLARMVHGQAQSGDLPVAEATVAFDRIARCVRRSAALAERLAQPVDEDARASGLQLATARATARSAIIRAVEDSIHQSCRGERAEALNAELRERLDSPELEDEIGARPVAEIIAEICCDLGLRGIDGYQAWKRRTPGDVTALRDLARAGSRGPPAGSARLLDHPGRFCEQ